MLDVGCGSGEVTRWIARRTGVAGSIVGVDVNPYLLREAASLARAEGVASQITFQERNAEALPFPSDSFDVTVSCTVMEEVNADRMLAEIIRVTRPGGRVAVMVRATDMGQWVNLPLPPDLRVNVERAGGAGVAEGGCADASLYRRFQASGLTALKMGPKLGTSHPGPGFADARRLFEPGQRAALGVEERETWDVAVAQADAEGTFMIAQPLHCAVGTKP